MLKKRKLIQNSKVPLRFDQRLILNRWLLSLFALNEDDRITFESLAEHLKDPAYEGLDENNVSRIYHVLTAELFNRPELPEGILLGYDENIVSHTLTISARRPQPIRWKYFQYLSLLFTEIYLDRFFSDPGKLLTEINAYVDRFNAGELTCPINAFITTPLPISEQIDHYSIDDLRKLAFWNATGSGKTLLMHVNILQYRKYLKREGRLEDVNRTILLTPNEGLSNQHKEEFILSGFNAEIFSKDERGLFDSDKIEIIDINKLRDEMGEKTVAIDAFEGNNLVLVDEGHRGSSGEEWKKKRDQLCETGFSFEYSATFGQAMKAANKRDLTQEYARCILFDYSYKYFYKDGYGKDYRILNLADDSDSVRRRKYLIACLLSFYQQQRLYEERKSEFRPFLIDRPLWIFVGGSVTKGTSKDDISDVQDILLFLASFLNDRPGSIATLDLLLSGRPGLHDPRGNEIFERSFIYLQAQPLRGEALYQDILHRLFNATASARLHVGNLKGVTGEVALRIGDHEPFGVINVGDSDALCRKLRNENSTVLEVADWEFSQSLFTQINDPASRINLLIGSKKFSEGWNSWRVSTMGLMNIGKKEGSQIIQLFGRGVRLKGLDYSLKRSSMLGLPQSQLPKHIRVLETLNIFGIHADYMRQFREYLEEEGLPANEDRIEFILPVVKNLQGKKLKVIRMPEHLDYKKGARPRLGMPPSGFEPIILDWYPKIQAMSSDRRGGKPQPATRDECIFGAAHLAFMDMDAIFFDLQRFKNERAWFNLNIAKADLAALLHRDDWYRIQIPHDEMAFSSIHQVRRWQEIAVALLRKYCDRYYKHQKAAWEEQYLEYRELDEQDPNFFQTYRLLIEESQAAIVSVLEDLKQKINTGALQQMTVGSLTAIQFSQHLYHPLLYVAGDTIEVSPVSLNEGERHFVLDLEKFYKDNTGYFAGHELYLLRNLSRGRGIGFFEAGNFHPDFILWLTNAQTQRIAFVDPKGIRNLEGLQDPKIQFYQTIKDIEFRLEDPSVILSSFIISNTPANQVAWWDGGMTEADFEEHNVLFQRTGNPYIRKLLDKLKSTPSQQDVIASVSQPTQVQQTAQQGATPAQRTADESIRLSFPQPGREQFIRDMLPHVVAMRPNESYMYYVDTLVLATQPDLLRALLPDGTQVQFNSSPQFIRESCAYPESEHLRVIHLRRHLVREKLIQYNLETESAIIGERYSDLTPLQPNIERLLTFAIEAADELHRMMRESSPNRDTALRVETTRKVIDRVLVAA